MCFRLALSSVLIFAGATVGCGASPAGPSVVLVVIDTLRADHLGAYGYERRTSPAIDARARQGAVFERAFSTAPWTLPSVGSMLTGQLPTRHGAGIVVHDVSEFPDREQLQELVRRGELLFYALETSLPTLAEVFQEGGYATAAIVNNSFLAPGFGVARGFDHYDFAEQPPLERPANIAVDLAIDWLGEHREQRVGQPFFLMLHLIDPHMPYAAPEPFRGKFVDPYAADLPAVLTASEMYELRDRLSDDRDDPALSLAIQLAIYDEEIAFADHELERFFDALDASGLGEDTIVAITSDHGEEFFDHGKFEHGHSVYNELVRIPLIVWGPGVVSGRYEAPVSLVDLMPTLLDAGGLSTPEGLAGESLWSLLNGGARPVESLPVPFDRLLFIERTLYGDEKKSVISWPWKALINVPDDYQELYQLERDPGELVNERSAEEDRYFTLLSALQATMLAADQQGRSNAVTLDEKTLKGLRNLGYIR